MHFHLPHPPTPEPKSSSAGSLHGHSSESGEQSPSYYAPLLYSYNVGSSKYESASQHSSSSSHGPALESQTAALETCERNETPSDTQNSRRLSVTERIESRPERSNSVAGSELRLLRRPPPDGYSLSYPRSHHREPSDAGASGSPSRIHHRRIHSLSISGNSSRSTSAYSTLSERSERATVTNEETESIQTRATTQSQMEQSRADTSSVINELLQQQASDLSRSAEEEPPGLQIYVDRSKGDQVVVAGPNMERLESVCP